MKLPYFAPVLLVLPLTLAGCGGGQPTSPGASAPPGLSNPAIAPALATMARQARAADSATAAAALSTRTVHVNAKRQVQVYVHVKQLTPALKKRLEQAGATDVLASKPLGVYQAWVSAAALARIATLPGVTTITPPVYGFTRPATH